LMMQFSYMSVYFSKSPQIASRFSLFRRRFSTEEKSDQKTELSLSHKKKNIQNLAKEFSNLNLQGKLQDIDEWKKLAIKGKDDINYSKFKPHEALLEQFLPIYSKLIRELVSFPKWYIPGFIDDKGQLGTPLFPMFGDNVCSVVIFSDLEYHKKFLSFFGNQAQISQVEKANEMEGRVLATSYLPELRKATQNTQQKLYAVTVDFTTEHTFDIWDQQIDNLGEVAQGLMTLDLIKKGNYNDPQLLKNGVYILHEQNGTEKNLVTSPNPTDPSKHYVLIFTSIDVLLCYLVSLGASENAGWQRVQWRGVVDLLRSQEGVANVSGAIINFKSEDETIVHMNPI